MMTRRRLPAPDFWKGRRVLLTGHTGFKGGWLSMWLHEMGARTTGVALAPNSRPNLCELAHVNELLTSCIQNIQDAPALAHILRQASPEIVFHLASQALVRPSYQQPLDTLATNVMGTAHVLEAVRTCPSVKVVICVTTDKVYRNNEWHHPYRESDHLGGHDPYSASKAASELVVAGYRDAFLTSQGIAVATARAGNVIGGGDWSKDRLIPDAVRAWQAGYPLEVRRPGATRPWQHVLEPLSSYLVLAEALWTDQTLAGPWNFGPDPAGNATVQSVVELARQAFGQGTVQYANNAHGPHEAGLLALDPSKSRQMLQTYPRWSLAETVERTMAWYRQQAQGHDARALCRQDLENYLA